MNKLAIWFIIIIACLITIIYLLYFHTKILNQTMKSQDEITTDFKKFLTKIEVHKTEE